MKALRTYPLAIAILLIIGWLSLGTPPNTNLDTITGIDKVAHICMYFGLSVVIWLEYLKYHDRLNWKKLVLFAILAPILYGGAMEIAQMTLTEHREGDWLDFLANSIGVLAGALAGYFVLRPAVWMNKR